MPQTVYLDASAVVKLVRQEAESAALETALAGDQERLSSLVVEVEVRRAARRFGLEERATDVLDRLTLLELEPEIASAAALGDPPGLRSLDAIHLATALSLGEELSTFVCYDGRLAAAADRAGLAVLAPA